MGIIMPSRRRLYQSAFALPTVLITSVVMLLVLLAAIQSVVSVSESIRGQYTDKIGKEAVQSGVAIAKACMAKNSGSITWTNAKPLKPNTDCTGTETLSCPANSTDTRCYVMIQGLYRTSYSVGVTLASDGTTVTGLDAKGITREVRKTSGDVISQSTMSVKGKMSVGAAVALATVGAKNNLMTYPQSNGTGNANQPLCATTDTGEVWCAGYGGDSNNYFDSITVYGTNIAFRGGASTCATDSGFTNTSGCYGTGTKYFLTNLTNASSGVFKGKKVTIMSPQAAGGSLGNFYLY